MNVSVGDCFSYHGIPLTVLQIKDDFVMLGNGEDVNTEELVNYERISYGSSTKSND